MKDIHLNIYADESKDREDELGNKWDYYSLVIVPTNKQDMLISQLLNARCITKNKWDFSCKGCLFHDKNNTEIHFARLSRNHEYQISQKWIKILLDNNLSNSGMIYLYVLGINKSYLDKNFWDAYENKDGAIYSKFFGTAIKILKYYFKEYEKIIIEHIYHDDSTMLEDENFYYGLIAYLSLDTKFKFITEKIQFVNSDHRKSNLTESHLIQFSDLLLGTITNYIHLSSRKQNKTELTRQMAPLISRIISYPRNYNSRYNYARKQQIKFFPQRKIFYYMMKDLNGIDTQMPFDDLFYTNRKCLFVEENTDKKQSLLKAFFGQ